MEDEADRLNNLCTDLVSLRNLEPGIEHLLQNRPGEWLAVADLYRVAGVALSQIKPELNATWLPSPSGAPGSVVILFCDDELQWSLTAYYNAKRLSESQISQLTAVSPQGPVR